MVVSFLVFLQDGPKRGTLKMDTHPEGRKVSGGTTLLGLDQTRYGCVLK